MSYCHIHILKPNNLWILDLCGIELLTVLEGVSRVHLGGRGEMAVWLSGQDLNVVSCRVFTSDGENAKAWLLGLTESLADLSVQMPCLLL